MIFIVYSLNLELCLLTILFLYVLGVGGRMLSSDFVEIHVCIQIRFFSSAALVEMTANRKYVFECLQRIRDCQNNQGH